MSRKLFGTDGIRGVAGEAPLDRPTAYALGVALGDWVLACADTDHRHVVIGMDTRESGPWLAEHVAGGLASRGVSTDFAGIITTPGVAYLARVGDYAAGVMISASHNPFADNGIKVIDHSGFKMPDAEELKLEESIFDFLSYEGAEIAPKPLAADPKLAEQYIAYLESTSTVRFDGLRVAMDCANGSAAALAPALFERLGATIVARLGVEPNGRNINLNCGSTHMESLHDAVVANKADVGIAFDGDADRALFIAKSGMDVDGDMVMLITAQLLGVKTVVATVMSNMGLEVALRDRGIDLVRTAVGDKYVLEEMVRRDLELGGEQSGHIIFRKWATTGDGMLTALRVLEVMQSQQKSLDDLAGEMKVYPQLLVNVRIKERRPLEDLVAVMEAINAAEAEFQGKGRVLVRFSGTEPLARVMAEGADQEVVDRWVHKIADELKAELGA
ncbi:phosphoglucosamine mutase [Bryobacterales bacterium F-183]|nr:phosphoglucosamine mutase [Bryobacterales bacterium F-183]